MALKIMTAKDFVSEPMDDGVYESIITEIAETKKFNNFQNVEQDVIQLRFKIIEGEYKDRTLTKEYSPSLVEKSNLMSLCRSVYGRNLTVEEMASVDTTEDIGRLLINKTVQIVVKNHPSKKNPGRMYYSISDYMKSKKVNTAAVAKEKVNNLSEDELKAIAAELEAGV